MSHIPVVTEHQKYKEKINLYLLSNNLNFFAEAITIGADLQYTVSCGGEECPKVCTCETAPLSGLPINSVLIKTQHHNSEQQAPSYQTKNEVLDEADDHEARHSLGEGSLRAATCVLQPRDNLPLFLSLSPDTQVLTILQGPGTENITLEEAYFQHLRSLVVLEIHGFSHSSSHLRLRNNALKHLSLLQYLNLQYVHLLGDKNSGNRPAPVSEEFLKKTEVQPPTLTREMAEDNDIIPEPIQLAPKRWEADVVPYSVYREQQERAGLTTFANLRSLVFLRAFHCGIKEVHWEMFEGLERLEYLSLEGNKIPFLHDFAFYGTPNLKHLVLSHNKLLDLQSMSLTGLFELETLNLSYNNISHLTEFSLPPLPSLAMADFHHNPLELILPYTFPVLNNTRQLFLGGKRAHLEIRPNSFIGLTKLHKISINGVQLEVLERDYFKGMPHLRGIRIEGTLHELSFDAFAEVPKLQELILKNCSVRKISMDAFFGLYELIYLDLSHNELETLPPSLFDHQRSLKEINLHSNKLTTLPAEIFIHTRAKLIRLDKNPWHCTCMMNEWQPSQVNKVKERITDNTLCQSRYDKGSMCNIRYTYQYTYDQSVTPRCATPARYKGWSVFHLLRKHLRCDKIYKHKSLKAALYDPTIHSLDKKDNGKKYSFNKTSSENKNNSNEQSLLIASSSESTVTVRSDSNLHNEGSPFVTSSREPTESKLETKPYTQIYADEGQTTEQNQNKKLLNIIPDNQHMWTDRNKEKYKQLMKKEKMLKDKAKSFSFRTEKQSQDNFKIHIDPVSKTKKINSSRKKYEMKMKNTMENLNEVPKSGTEMT